MAVLTGSGTSRRDKALPKITGLAVGQEGHDVPSLNAWIGVRLRLEPGREALHDQRVPGESVRQRGLVDAPAAPAAPAPVPANHIVEDGWQRTGKNNAGCRFRPVFVNDDAKNVVVRNSMGETVWFLTIHLVFVRSVICPQDDFSWPKTTGLRGFAGAPAAVHDKDRQLCLVLLINQHRTQNGRRKWTWKLFALPEEPSAVDILSPPS